MLQNTSLTLDSFLGKLQFLAIVNEAVKTDPLPYGWLHVGGCVCVRVSMFAVSTMCVRVSADPLSSALCVAAAIVRYLCAALCLINAASSLNVCAATSRTMHKFGRVTANPAYSLCRSTCLSPFLYMHSSVFYCRFYHGNCFLCEHRWYGPWLCECYLSRLTPATIYWPLATFRCPPSPPAPPPRPPPALLVALGCSRCVIGVASFNFRSAASQWK